MSNWRDSLKEIKNKVDLKNKWASMGADHFALTVAGQDIDETRQRLGGVIQVGAITEHQQYKANLKAAWQGRIKAKQNEINRWDAGKLKAEIELAAYRIAQTMQSGGGPFDQPLRDQLEALAGEYRNSGDIVKQRAFAEAVRGSLAGGANIQNQNDRIAASFLASQANEDLKALRVTDEMRQADQVYNQAATEYVNFSKELREVGNLVEGADPLGFANNGLFNHALRTVQFAQDGTPTFYELNDPEILGYDLSKIMPAATGGTEVK